MGKVTDDKRTTHSGTEGEELQQVRGTCLIHSGLGRPVEKLTSEQRHE